MGSAFYVEGALLARLRYRISCHLYYTSGAVIRTLNQAFAIFSPHYDDVIMGAMASQSSNLTIVYSTVYSDADQTKHQSSASPAIVRGIHWGPVNSPHKWSVTRKMSQFDDVIMKEHGHVPVFILQNLSHWALVTHMMFHNWIRWFVT